MGKWVLYENSRQHLTLLHRNLVDDQVFFCGELRADTPEPMIVEWLTERAQPGDLIKLPDGRVLTVVREGARA